MYQIFLAIIIISTLFVCIFQPNMHKPLFVYDNKYTIVANKDDIKPPKQVIQAQDIEIINTKVPEIKKTVSKTEVTPKNEVKFESAKNIVPIQTSKTKEIKKEPQKTITKAQTIIAKTQQTSTTDTKKEDIQTKTVNVPKPSVSKNVSIETKETAKPDIKQNNSQIQAILPTNTYQESIEEQISWNKWHSRIQNQIMDDAKLPTVPYGTIFYFSFNVDKYGKISNVATYGNPAQYTPYAIQYIAPVIRSYQGREILNFPPESRRETTKFEGKFKISTKMGYSSPSNYNDTEKIRK